MAMTNTPVAELLTHAVAAHVARAVEACPRGAELVVMGRDALRFAYGLAHLCCDCDAGCSAGDRAGGSEARGSEATPALRFASVRVVTHCASVVADFGRTATRHAALRAAGGRNAVRACCAVRRVQAEGAEVLPCAEPQVQRVARSGYALALGRIFDDAAKAGRCCIVVATVGRLGLGPGVCETVASAPAARCFAHVGCCERSAAADLERLVGPGSARFVCGWAHRYDAFPDTQFVQTAAWLERAPALASLVICCGPPACGKTSVARAFAARVRAQRGVVHCVAPGAVVGGDAGREAAPVALVLLERDAIYASLLAAGGARPSVRARKAATHALLESAIADAGLGAARATVLLDSCLLSSAARRAMWALHTAEAGSGGKRWHRSACFALSPGDMPARSAPDAQTCRLARWAAARGSTHPTFPQQQAEALLRYCLVEWQCPSARGGAVPRACADAAAAQGEAGGAPPLGGAEEEDAPFDVVLVADPASLRVPASGARAHGGDRESCAAGVAEQDAPSELDVCSELDDEALELAASRIWIALYWPGLPAG
ncbi:hypothetical protein T492DRAFT_1104729 [Pavlovales sp. CCMP2436]|nr:hypothetical protein T492DRAFT_1104729 [Pavlovales sp. CCMP2436]